MIMIMSMGPREHRAGIRKVLDWYTDFRAFLYRAINGGHLPQRRVVLRRANQIGLGVRVDRINGYWQYDVTVWLPFFVVFVGVGRRVYT